MAEENEVENEYNPIADLVQHSLDQDYNNASKVFGDIMSVKLNDVMDQEQVKLASQVYNGSSEEDEDDQLELDLGNEEQPDDDTAEDDEEIDDEEDEEIDDEEDEEKTS